jgi:small subunit ribosomal protein S21
MLLINVQEIGSIDRALKVLKKKFSKTKTLDQLRDRKEFKKPSVKHRDEIKNAIYRQRLLDNNSND